MRGFQTEESGRGQGVLGDGIGLSICWRRKVDGSEMLGDEGLREVLHVG